MTTASNHEELTYEQYVLSSGGPAGSGGGIEQLPGTPNIWKTRIRIFARDPAGDSQDISPVVENVTWQDQSSDDLQNINTQAMMIGSITLRKPNLRDYKKLAGLVYPGPFASFSERVGTTGVGAGVASPGALGGVFVCQVGYGDGWQNIWAMRVCPGADSTAADTVALSSGSQTLTLADDLWLLSQSVADFKYTKGTVTRKNGWRCDEIAADVCKNYRVPVRSLAQGTARFELPVSDTQLTSPLTVISKAYEEETKRTGRTFIIRWGPPGKIYPSGALEVTPMRRNLVLYKFRDQLTEATLSKTQGSDFATVVEARGQLGSQKITYTAYNWGAVTRHGFIRKTVNFGTVSSRQELEILAKRSLAIRLTPVRAAELTHPGFPTIRRGDAIHIDIPEEGYEDVELTAYETPAATGSKQYVAALRAAEASNPTLFAQPGKDMLWPTADTSGGTAQAADANVPEILPVANQGVAFVTSAVHTASTGQYTMDLTLGFADVLDPNRVRAQVDAAVRGYKSGSPVAVTTASPFDTGGSTTTNATNQGSGTG